MESSESVQAKASIFILSDLDDYGLSADEFRIVARIARRGDCSESVSSMATGCRISERQVRYALKVLLACRIASVEERIGATSVYRLRPLAEWVTPEQYEYIRKATLTPNPDKKPLHRGTAHAAEGAAGNAGLQGMQGGAAANADGTAHAAAKGNPSKVIPEGNPEESANADGAKKPRRVSDEDLLRFKRRDGLIAHLKAKLNGEDISDLKAQKGAALWLVKRYSDEQCFEVLDYQWDSDWRDSADWKTVRQGIGQYFARKVGGRNGKGNAKLSSTGKENRNPDSESGTATNAGFIGEFASYEELPALRDGDGDGLPDSGEGRSDVRKAMPVSGQGEHAGQVESYSTGVREAAVLSGIEIGPNQAAEAPGTGGGVEAYSDCPVRLVSVLRH